MAQATRGQAETDGTADVIERLPAAWVKNDGFPQMAIAPGLHCSASRQGIARRAALPSRPRYAYRLPLTGKAERTSSRLANSWASSSHDPMAVADRGANPNSLERAAHHVAYSFDMRISTCGAAMSSALLACVSTTCAPSC